MFNSSIIEKCFKRISINCYIIKINHRPLVMEHGERGLRLSDIEATTIEYFNSTESASWSTSAAPLLLDINLCCYRYYIN